MISDGWRVSGRQLFAYHQTMEFLTRLATWIDRVATAVIAPLLRGSMAVLAIVLRRGKHRAWRRENGARRHSETSSP